MASAKVTVDTEKLLKLVQNIDKAVDIGTERAADLILDLAKQFAPKDTEQLADSGKVENAGQAKRIVSFGDGLPDQRAAAQEFGTHDMPAQPYLGPASRNIDVAQEIAAEIAKLL